MTATSRRLPPRRHPDTSVEYDGELPYVIKFFEGELRLIADCLRCAGPQKVVKQPGSTHGVARNGS
jgi:hypothetical protein